MSAATLQARHPGLVRSTSITSEAVSIRTALSHPRFHTILDAHLESGLGRAQEEWGMVAREGAPETRRVQPDVARMLPHTAEGYADAQAGD